MFVAVPEAQKRSSPFQTQFLTFIENSVKFNPSFSDGLSQSKIVEQKTKVIVKEIEVEKSDFNLKEMK